MRGDVRGRRVDGALNAHSKRAFQWRILGFQKRNRSVTPS